MKFIILLPFLLLAACESKKDSAANRQQAIQEQMGVIKTAYFKKVDSLENVKQQDTSSVRQNELMKILVAADSQKTSLLIPLQKEYDSLQAVLTK